MRDVAPTRSALMELREERHAMDEAYRFLDEKRLILAAEILRQLERYEALMERFRRQYAKACDVLRAATLRHGLEGLEVYPTLSLAQARLQVARRSVLDVTVQQVELTGPPAETASAPNPSPEALQCQRAFSELLPLTAQLAGVSGNLERLRKEYRRTARRARALEDVLLPEIDDTLASLQLSLEELEREDLVRVRFGR